MLKQEQEQNHEKKDPVLGKELSGFQTETNSPASCVPIMSSTSVQKCDLISFSANIYLINNYPNQSVSKMGTEKSEKNNIEMTAVVFP